MFLAGLAASLNQIGHIQAHLPAMASVIMAVVGVGLVVVPGLLHIAAPIETIAHEGAHATVGSALGHRVTHMDFKFNGAGATGVVAKSGSSLAVFPSVFIGYLGPSAFGIGAAELIRIGHIVAVLWIGLVGLVPILFLARKSLGVVLVIGVFVALVLLLAVGTVGAQVATSYGLAWFLLISGLRSITKHKSAAADAGILKDMTGLPRGFWPPLWLAGSVAALIFGATQLL
jgi:hypothetical protein